MGSLNAGVSWDQADYIVQTVPFNWKTVIGKRILITGATGLIGAQLTRVLLTAADRLNLDMHLILPVRDERKAKLFFGDESRNISYIKWDLETPDLNGIEFNFAFHLASPTSSSFFKESPVETIKQIIGGSEAVLNCATRCKAEKIIFLSSMEVYGEIETVARETQIGSMDTMIVRNCYPEAKKLVECLCASYAEEFGVACTVARLSQCFGEGVAREDNRVFAEFARRAVSGENIVLFTDGLKKNMYVSVDDAVSALLILLEKGESQHIYNIANEKTYCSVKEMAYFVKEVFGPASARVCFKKDTEREAIFRKSSNLKLDCSEIRKLGWFPTQDLFDMYALMISGWGFDPVQFRSKHY